MNHNALAAVTRDEWSVMLEQASMLVKTGFLPKDINTPEKAVAVMLKGRELNIPPMHALSTIAVIQGKPTVSPELMAALVERDYGSNALIVEETDSDHCVVSCCKPGWDKRRVVSFTMAEATNAGLPNKNPTWKTYPEAMLRSRAISKACKTHFQASIGGMYTPEEMGAVVNEDGAYEALPATQPIRPNEPVWDTQPILNEPDTMIDMETGEIMDGDFPGVGDLIIEALESTTDKRDLATLKRRIRDENLTDNTHVTEAYNAAYERLHGASAVIDTGQAVLV
jgi:hypothetical protein